MSVSDKKNQKRGLGRGFESLIPIDLLDESFDPTASQDHQVSELRQIKLSEIVADADQPRKAFDDEALNDLAVSISEHGVVQPIIVTPFNGGYKIVAGERRFKASKIAKLDKIPALVRTLSDQHKLEISLIENLQRQDLNVIETATAYLKLRDQFNLQLEEIGRRVGNKSSSAISNTLRLLKLPSDVIELLATGKLTEGQARPLVGLDEDIIKEVIPKILREGWSTRRIEQFIVDIKKCKSDPNAKADVINSKPYAEQIKSMRNKLKADVDIRTNSRGAGRITIKFRNEREFKRLQEILG